MMKKRNYMALSMLFTSSVWANYQINAEFASHNRRPSFSKIVIEEGKVGTMHFGHTSIKIRPVKQRDDSVMINSQIIERENGEDKILSRAKIITSLGSPAEISSRDDDGDSDLRLKLTATLVGKRN